jgi:hypothetical protein
LHGFYFIHVARAGQPTDPPVAAAGRSSRREKDKRRKRNRRHSSKSTDSSESESSVEKRRRKKRKSKKKKSKSSSSGSEDVAVLSSDDDLSSGDDLSKLTPEQIATGKITWHLLNKAWPYDQRPPYLRKRNIIYQNTLEVWLGYMKQVDSLEKKKNLGEEVFAKDGKPEKIHFKAKTDNGVNKLHLARTLRLPVAHPKHWFKIIPKKRDEIVRNFPMDHLGLTGHIPDDVIGRLHNRSVKITLDLFCKSTHHEAVGSQKAGKYSDIHQIRAGINHFCLALHCIWPYDYTGLVITEVLNEAHWAEEATADQRKRCELITELFNTVLADNSAKAVYNMYPLIYEQVRHSTVLMVFFLSFWHH